MECLPWKKRLEKQYIDPGVCVCTSLKEKRNLLFRFKKSHQRMAVTIVVAWLLIAERFVTASSHCKFFTLNLFSRLKHLCDGRERTIHIDKVLNFPTALFSTLQLVTE